MSNKQAKPCPFCGARPVRHEQYNHASGKNGYYMACDNPKCLIQPYTPMYYTKGADMKAWNKRAKERE